MPAYARPSLPAEHYVDAHGEPIAYGRRWSDSPADDAYSVVTHPQRFLPVQTVARKLIAHLEATYDVAVEASHVADFAHPEGVLEALRVRPGSISAAPLAFGFTTLPGVFLRAGALYEQSFPFCGCDACDDGIADVVQSLEDEVFAVVRGHLTEALTGTSLAWSIAWDSGSSESSRGIEDAERLAGGRRALEAAGGAWRPWPLR